MRPIESYKKRPKGAKREECKITSVMLYVKQKEYIDDAGLNLSEMVRDMINDCMTRLAPKRK